MLTDPDKASTSATPVSFPGFLKKASWYTEYPIIFKGELIRMTTLEAIDARHSVRAYQDRPIDQDTRRQLDWFITKCNQESGLNIFIRYDDPDGFDSRLAHYGHFRNVKNYIVLSGKKNADFEYLCGYYGEKIVLFAQQHGLNTCLAALTFNKKIVKKQTSLRS